MTTAMEKTGKFDLMIKIDPRSFGRILSLPCSLSVEHIAGSAYSVRLYNARHGEEIGGAGDWLCRYPNGRFTIIDRDDMAEMLKGGAQ